MKHNITDGFFEQAVQITKAHAYDILAEHNKQLRHEIDILKIELKAANAMLKAYEGFVSDIKPKDAINAELAVNDIPDTLFKSLGEAFPLKP